MFFSRNLGTFCGNANFQRVLVFIEMISQEFSITFPLHNIFKVFSDKVIAVITTKGTFLKTMLFRIFLKRDYLSEYTHLRSSVFRFLPFEVIENVIRWKKCNTATLKKPRFWRCFYNFSLAN